VVSIFLEKQNGFLPDPDWKQERFGERWYIGDDYHAAIGQGFVTATPLQVFNSIVTIANGGILQRTASGFSMSETLLENCLRSRRPSCAGISSMRTFSG
jgi:hypothetical protein